MYEYYSKLKEPEITPIKAGFMFLLCAIWLLTGLVGHDPWKPDEAYGFGLIYHILQNHEWIVPTLAGEPYVDKPPLYYWTAAIFAKLFSPLLSLHDGARLASGFYAALTLVFTGLSGRELFGNNRGWPAAIILIGCLGMLVRTHEILTDNALLAGCAMMLYGYALSLRKPKSAGVLIGIGMGIGFMSKGFIAPMLFLYISLGLLMFRNWRTRSYLATLCIALLCALPWLTVWPYLLFQHSPYLFIEWAWTRNIGRWLGFVRDGELSEMFYYIKALPWMAWPAAPLAAWTVWEARKRVWQEAEFQLLLTAFIVMLVTLSLVPDVNDQNGLPMLLPIALLATASLSTLRRGAANALDWFGIMTFALLAIMMWWGWAGLLLGYNAKIVVWLRNYQPGFEAELETLPFTIAIIVTVLWLVLVWRVGRSVRRSLINWAVGVTLLWVLIMTLWLPWLDSGKSYRHMVEDLKSKLPVKYNCIADVRIGDSERAMLQYFGNIKTRSSATRVCDLLLVQGDRIARPIEDEIGWEKIWEGSRKGDQNERFRLYKRVRK
ncbi:MAG: glycosyltransferase family 39 protein [Gammaproteobacteria bacterium]|nr:glycosyltransferase family 39 protein [Gammaproteobacteria bacterium]MBU1775409.1 glycosyltransferase family 39 protein [Gammaproteobacteria bacterium]MBU1968841.1 glycosyltransferase family 39 protein [Gammaproteobacteria bacterium]